MRQVGDAMDETGARTDGTEPRPFWAIGLALLALVLVLLAGAFLLTRHFTSHVGIEPTAHRPGKTIPSPATHRSGGAPATTSPTAATTATPAPTAQATPTLSPRQQVTQAYHRYWQTYSQALYTLDTSRMDTVATDSELKRVQAEVAGFRREGRAVHVRVTHDAVIVSLKGDAATVYDEQHDRSFLIDPVTKGPHVGPNSPAHLEKDIYYFKKVHGVWKVVKSLRQQG